MAELLVGAITGAVVSAVLNELIDLAKGVYRCKEVCDDLVECVKSIDPLLAKANDPSYAKNIEVQDWLTCLHSLLLKAKDLVENCVVKRFRFSRQYMRRGLVSTKIKDTHNSIIRKMSSEGALVIFIAIQGISRKVDDSLSVVKEINCKVDGLSIAIDRPPPFKVQEVPSHIAAFDNNPFEELKKLIHLAPDIKTRSIGVKGRGGAGKTLLAKMVNNDKDIKEKYGSILWFTIGHDVSVFEVYKRMGKYLKDGGIFERDISGEDLIEQRTYLTQAFKLKKVLVILDDVWARMEKNRPMIEWLDIFKGEGSTTLITTRNDEVLKCAKVMEKIEVGLLSKDESWKLFSFHAFQPNMRPSSKIEAIAMEICDECKGLPLAYWWCIVG